eukprot:s290_g23.t1
MEAKMVSRILEDSGVNALLKEHKVTRMTTPPRARNEDDPVEISSDEGDGDEFSGTVERDQPEPCDEDEDMDQEPEEAEDVEMGGEDEDEEEPHSEAKKRRTEVRQTKNQFQELVNNAANVVFCFHCGGQHHIENCPNPGRQKVAAMLGVIQDNLERESKSPMSGKTTTKSTRGRKDKLPKTSMPKKRRWSRSAETKNQQTENIPYLLQINLSEV